MPNESFQYISCEKQFSTNGVKGKWEPLIRPTLSRSYVIGYGDKKMINGHFDINYITLCQGNIPSGVNHRVYAQKRIQTGYHQSPHVEMYGQDETTVLKILV